AWGARIAMRRCAGSPARVWIGSACWSWRRGIGSRRCATGTCSARQTFPSRPRWCAGWSGNIARTRVAMCAPRVSGCGVATHWTLAYPYEGFHVPCANLLGSPNRLELCGRSIRDLPDEEWLVLLAIHGARHRYSRLHWLGAIADLVSARPQLNWSRAAELAGQ